MPPVIKPSKNLLSGDLLSGYIKTIYVLQWICLVKPPDHETLFVDLTVEDRGKGASIPLGDRPDAFSCIQFPS